MSDSHELLDDDTLATLLDRRRRNLRYLEQQAAKQGGQISLQLHNDLEDTRREIEQLLETQRRRGDRSTSTGGVAAAAPGDPAPLPRAPGSPFVVGRPLRAGEPIFGRDAAFRFIAAQLAAFSSVNVVGERRIGKTTLLNHLIGHQDRYLPPRAGQPPLIVVYLDLLDNISTEARLYGAALRELVTHLPDDRVATLPELADLRSRLATKPEADYDLFRHTLRQLRDPNGAGVCPVVVVDEFERLLDPALGAGFPYPTFYDGVRSLIGANLLAMVVASCRPLAEYFSDPARPNTLTSKFPTYFMPFGLEPLGGADADALLLQPSDHPLALAEVEAARRWAGGHPCHLQVAGQALYEAKAEGYPAEWANRRREELRAQSCMTGAAAAGRSQPQAGRLRRVLSAIKKGLGL